MEKKLKAHEIVWGIMIFAMFVVGVYTTFGAVFDWAPGVASWVSAMRALPAVVKENDKLQESRIDAILARLKVAEDRIARIDPQFKESSFSAPP